MIPSEAEMLVVMAETYHTTAEQLVKQVLPTYSHAMNLKDASDHAERMAVRTTGKDAVALHVLVEAARRLLRAKRAVRDLADAVGAREAVADLNQTSLFEGGER